MSHASRSTPGSFALAWLIALPCDRPHRATRAQLDPTPLPRRPYKPQGRASGSSFPHTRLLPLLPFLLALAIATLLELLPRALRALLLRFGPASASRSPPPPPHALS